MPAASLVGAGRLPARIWAASSLPMLVSSMVVPPFAADGAMRYCPTKLPRPMI